jgi:hypothetical protein
MRRILLAALMLVLPRIAQASDDTVIAGAEAMIPADQRVEKPVKLGENNVAPILIITAKMLSREPTLPTDEAKYQKEYADGGVYMTYALDVKLKSDDAHYMVVRCDSGGSNDPECVFSTSTDPEKDGVSIPGTVFAIPGDGCVYSGGHTNNMFGARAIACLQGGQLTPRLQPFRYAGFQSKALVDLYLAPNKNDELAVVTKIPKGAFVEVVLQDGDYFLLRDRFGLTGWARLEQKQEPAEIEGFYYNGD